MKYSEEELEQVIDEMKGFLASYKEADDKFRDEQDSKFWQDKYGERFAPYSDKLKLLNGDDFSIVDAARKEYHSKYSDLTDDEYCEALENNIKATIQRIWPEAPEEKVEEVAEAVKEEVVETEEEPTKEEIHIESEDKDGDGKISEDETEVHAMEEKQTEQEADESEEDRFVKDLEDYKANMPKRG